VRVIYTSRDIACRWPGCPCDGLNPPGSPQHYTENIWSMRSQEYDQTKVITWCANGHVVIEMNGTAHLMYSFPPWQTITRSPRYGQ